MSRPPFYAGTAPSQWLRTPRTGHNPAELACAIERYVRPNRIAVALWIVGVVVFGAPLVLHLIARAAS